MTAALISLSAILLPVTPSQSRICIFVCIDDDAPAVNGFCQAYQRVLRAQGESTKGLSLALRKRIAANDVLYRCTCEAWTNPICAQTRPK